jgi:hypothetical protein
MHRFVPFVVHNIDVRWATLKDVTSFTSPNAGALALPPVSVVVSTTGRGE